GRHDHFFELGGHSLMVAQFITRVREKFGVTLPLFNVYQTPTVAALAEIILDQQLGQFGSDDVQQAMDDIANLSEAEIDALLAQEHKLLNN
ncbi:MAG: hypothetical protein JO218_15625, partial [Burkholderiales bacterium]|nr:hypothetical protein [Burkholderiales bacterium]